MSEILVIGHRNPDADAICSAIGYADYKRRTGTPNVIAARCGDTNDRIDFILETFNTPAPRFVSDISPRVKDVMQQEIIYTPSGSSIADALGVMDNRNIRALPVLREDKSCEGMVSVFKMTQFLLPATNRPYGSRRVLASLSSIARCLDADLLTGNLHEHEEDLLIMVGAMSLEKFSHRLKQYHPERMVVLVGDRHEIQFEAINNNVRMMIVTGKLPVQGSLLEAAKNNGVNILSCPHDTATTAMLCRSATVVDHVLHEDFLTFQQNESLDHARRVATASPSLAFPVLNSKKQVVGMLSKTDFLKKINRQLILVDHNEIAQAVRGADSVEILEIIDHHRIGTLSTNEPILFRNEPVGSTSTIVAELYRRDDVELTTSIAGLLLAGVVSDTLNLNSPTTTDRDKNILKWLEEKSGVNATEFTEKLFASGSLLISRPVSQAICGDCKEYTEKGIKFSVAQIEEIHYTHFWTKKKEAMDELENYRQKHGYHFSSLLITDITSHSSLLVVCGAKEIVREIDYPKLEPGIFELAGVVSRKKQLLPFLIRCIEATDIKPET